MEFYLEDFTEGTKKTIREEFDFSKNEEDKPVAVRFNAAANEKTPEVDAEIQQILKLIPALIDCGIDDFALTYDDCGIWRLRWHNREYDNMGWTLTY